MRNLIGKRVREARRKLNPPLTQRELVIRLELSGWDISRATLSKIEAGLRQVTDFEVVILADVLGVTFDWLLDKSSLKDISIGKRRLPKAD